MSAALVRSFGPHDLHLLEYRGAPVIIAGEVGAALGYADPRKLGTNIAEKWSDEFVEGLDHHKLVGEELAAFKGMCSNWIPDRDPVVGARTPNLLLLTESGAQLAAMLSRTAAGRAFRRWLLDVVLPEWRALRAPASPAPPVLVEETANSLTLRESETLIELARVARSSGRAGLARQAIDRAATLLMPEVDLGDADAQLGHASPPGLIEALGRWYDAFAEREVAMRDLEAVSAIREAFDRVWPGRGFGWVLRGLRGFEGGGYRVECGRKVHGAHRWRLMRT